MTLDPKVKVLLEAAKSAITDPAQAKIFQEQVIDNAESLSEADFNSIYGYALFKDARDKVAEAYKVKFKKEYDASSATESSADVPHPGVKPVSQWLMGGLDSIQGIFNKTANIGGGQKNSWPGTVLTEGINWGLNGIRSIFNAFTSTLGDKNASPEMKFLTETAGSLAVAAGMAIGVSYLPWSSIPIIGGALGSIAPIVALLAGGLFGTNILQYVGAGNNNKSWENASPSETALLGNKTTGRKVDGMAPAFALH